MIRLGQALVEAAPDKLAVWEAMPAAAREAAADLEEHGEARRRRYQQGRAGLRPPGGGAEAEDCQSAPRGGAQRCLQSLWLTANAATA